ncbi:arylesterase [Novosphingobium aerophilum]|uniref:Arylesterase n=1 Tax=Novosphingobium aerophilum TaxID=2839843 RepID=A0A7X1F9U8_9SPHN|nr:arylesterase [Novosphingobium aerophilum]MBC2653078.1 arylesterase [Novosphingobium aerophilum]
MYRLVSLLVLAAMVGACSRSAPIPEPAATLAGPATDAAAAADLPPVMGPERRILAVGDSLFAGYGLASPAESYPARLETALRARGINARISNAGVSGDTSGAGAERFAFVLRNQPRKPDLVLIEFGGNDILRALPPEQTRANLDRMLAAARAEGVPVLLMGMLAPPNLGPDYKAKFEPLYPALAKQYGARLVPFFLAPVIGKPDLIQADHIHPNARGVDEIVAATADQVAAALPGQ